jgi:hypothetical protein
VTKPTSAPAKLFYSTPSAGLISGASLSFEELQTSSFAELLPILEELERRNLIQKIPNDGTTTYKVSPLLPGGSDNEAPAT